MALQLAIANVFLTGGDWRSEASEATCTSLLLLVVNTKLSYNKNKIKNKNSLETNI